MAPANINPIYKALSPEENLSLTLSEEEEVHFRPSARQSKLILSLTTGFFALLSLYLAFAQQRQNLCIASTRPFSAFIFQKGYETEWEPAKAAIETQKVTYTSVFRYNSSDGTFYRDFDPTTPQYVGTPSPEIDKAWMDLLAGQYLVLSEEEAMKLDDPVDIKGYYLGEVEVMHSLHCLNAIRKEIHRDYYKMYDTKPLPEAIQQVHVKHCLEQLRQNIQCAGDLTPVLLRPYGEAPNINLIGTPQAHPCRNWDTFRRWWTKRGNATGSINGGGT